MGLIEINIVYRNQSLIDWPFYIIVHVCLQLFIVHLVYPIVQKWLSHPYAIKWFQCGQYIYIFAYSMAVILYTLWFSMVIVFICSNRGLHFNDFNIYVMGKICCLYCLLFLFCAIVLKVVKLQVISSSSEQNIFILVDKMVNIFQ